MTTRTSNGREKIYPFLILDFPELRFLFTMSDSEESSSQYVYLEIGTEHYEEDLTLSTSLCRVLKFKNVEESLLTQTKGIAEVAGMVRGDPDIVVAKIKSVYLALVTEAQQLAVVGHAPKGDSEDPRIFSVTEWTASCPLPLGGVTFSRLRLVFLLNQPLDPVEETLKIGADIISVPSKFIENNPKMRRVMSWTFPEVGSKQTVMRLRAGTLLCLESAVDVRQQPVEDIGLVIFQEEQVLQGLLSTMPLPPQREVRSKSFWEDFEEQSVW